MSPHDQLYSFYTQAIHTDILPPYQNTTLILEAAAEMGVDWEDITEKLE
jgi:hypothetical protein